MYFWSLTTLSFFSFTRILCFAHAPTGVFLFLLKLLRSSRLMATSSFASLSGVSFVRFFLSSLSYLCFRAVETLFQVTSYRFFLGISIFASVLHAEDENTCAISVRFSSFSSFLFGFDSFSSLTVGKFALAFSGQRNMNDANLPTNFISLSLPSDFVAFHCPSSTFLIIITIVTIAVKFLIFRTLVRWTGIAMRALEKTSGDWKSRVGRFIKIPIWYFAKLSRSSLSMDSVLATGAYCMGDRRWSSRMFSFSFFIFSSSLCLVSSSYQQGPSFSVLISRPECR